MNDPFGLYRQFDIMGMRVIESPDRPRYVLPPEIIPGVPWPPGFREEINAWSIRVLGTWNPVPLGSALMFSGNIVMRPSDVVRITNIGLA